MTSFYMMCSNNAGGRMSSLCARDSGRMRSLLCNRFLVEQGGLMSDLSVHEGGRMSSLCRHDSGHMRPLLGNVHLVTGQFLLLFGISAFGVF